MVALCCYGTCELNRDHFKTDLTAGPINTVVHTKCTHVNTMCTHFKKHTMCKQCVNMSKNNYLLNLLYKLYISPYFQCAWTVCEVSMCTTPNTAKVLRAARAMYDTLLSLCGRCWEVFWVCMAREKELNLSYLSWDELWRDSVVASWTTPCYRYLITAYHT